MKYNLNIIIFLKKNAKFQIIYLTNYIASKKIFVNEKSIILEKIPDQNPDNFDMLENEIVKNNNSDVLYNVTKIKNEKLYKYIFCEFCSAKFEKEKEYRAHLKDWHVRSKEAKTNGLVNQPKALQCELCKYKNYSQGIIRHMEKFHRVTEKLKKDKECLCCSLANEPLSIFSSYEAVRLHINVRWVVEFLTRVWKISYSKR